MGESTENRQSPRRICIIGAGLSGLGYLHALTDLPAEARQGWKIDVYEHRDEAGGIWVPQPTPPPPPDIPETPSYDDLECITLGTGITFPNRPLPPSSLLFPRIETINEYIRDHIRDFKLSKYIHLRHTVTACSLDANAADYPWSVTVERMSAEGNKETFTKGYSTIVVGNGVTPTPRRLDLPGAAEWLAESKGRKILHSMWYRNTSIAKGREVVIVGNHPSGNHIAAAVCGVASEVHHVWVPDMLSGVFPVPVGDNYTHHATRVERFNTDSIELGDGTAIRTDSETLVIECTGYWRDHPFLPPSVVRHVQGEDFTWDSAKLESNDRYMRPLYKCLLPIDPSIPYGSLAFACLFPIIWNFPTSYAQGIWFAHLLADLDRNGSKSRMLPDRQAALEDIRQLEEKQKGFGVDMAKRGYMLVPPGLATDNLSDTLIREVREGSSFALPDYLQLDPQREFTEPWRRRAFQVTLGLVKAWKAAKEEGIEASFSKGAKTEEEFAEATEKMQAWWDQKKGGQQVNGSKT